MTIQLQLKHEDSRMRKPSTLSSNYFLCFCLLHRVSLCVALDVLEQGLKTRRASLGLTEICLPSTGIKDAQPITFPRLSQMLV